MISEKALKKHREDRDKWVGEAWAHLRGGMKIFEHNCSECGEELEEEGICEECESKIKDETDYDLIIKYGGQND